MCSNQQPRQQHRHREQRIHRRAHAADRNPRGTSLVRVFFSSASRLRLRSRSHSRPRAPPLAEQSFLHSVRECTSDFCSSEQFGCMDVCMYAYAHRRTGTCECVDMSRVGESPFGFFEPARYILYYLQIFRGYDHKTFKKVFEGFVDGVACVNFDGRRLIQTSWGGTRAVARRNFVCH